MSKSLLITAPTSTSPVTVEDLLAHSRIDSDEENTELVSLLAAATDEAESYTWRRFLTQTWERYYDSFDDPLYLPFPPVSSITHVKYYDAAGTLTTVAATVYELGEVNGEAVCRLKYGQVWPTARDHPDSVVVRYICGYGDTEDVPQQILHAIRIHAAHYFEHREGEVPLPDTFSRLLSPYTVRSWGQP